MKFEEYKLAVRRTLPDMGSVILNSVHMTLGMGSEIYELKEAIENEDKVNIAEELTDIAWYACNFCYIRHIIPFVVLEPIDQDDNEDNDDFELFIENHLAVIANISELQDYDKKEFAYNRPVTDAIIHRRVELINNILDRLNWCYYYAGLNPEQAMQNNIDKLKARFPDKFDSAKALDRDLEKERKELEK